MLFIKYVTDLCPSGGPHGVVDGHRQVTDQRSYGRISPVHAIRS